VILSNLLMTLAKSESRQVGTKLEAQVELSLKHSGEGLTLAKSESRQVGTKLEAQVELSLKRSGEGLTLAKSESRQVGTKLEAEVELSLKRSGEGLTLAKITRIMCALVIVLRLMYKLQKQGWRYYADKTRHHRGS
jgi:hypothetical protein